MADRACSVGINADILERFRRERLFWTLNHPRSHPLNELTVRLLDRSGLVARADRAGTVRTIEVAFTSPEPSANIQVPVHPDVAAVLGLTWYRPSQRCCCFGLKSASYADYWNAYIHYTFTPPAFAERRVA